MEHLPCLLIVHSQFLALVFLKGHWVAEWERNPSLITWNVADIAELDGSVVRLGVRSGSLQLSWHQIVLGR